MMPRRYIVYILLLLLLSLNCVDVYSMNYSIYYKSIGIVVPKKSDITKLNNFIEYIRKYNLFKSYPKLLYGISSKRDIENIDILIFGIYPDNSLLNDSSIEIIGSWFEQGGKFIIFFNPLYGDYRSIYKSYNKLLDRIGSKIKILYDGSLSGSYISVFNSKYLYKDDYNIGFDGDIKIYNNVDGVYSVGSSYLGRDNKGDIHILTYYKIASYYYASSILERIYAYSDLFTKVYSKVYLSMDNPLQENWFKYGNHILFSEVLSWGVSTHTEMNLDGLTLISLLIALGLSPYLYIYVYLKKNKVKEDTTLK